MLFCFYSEPHQSNKLILFTCIPISNPKKQTNMSTNFPLLKVKQSRSNLVISKHLTILKINKPQTFQSATLTNKRVNRLCSSRSKTVKLVISKPLTILKITEPRNILANTDRPSDHPTNWTTEAPPELKNKVQLQFSFDA